jgi:hypothetical protein
MKHGISAIAMIASLLLSSAAIGKSETIRLEISGVDLIEPVSINEPEVLKSFSIWGSPGIDWSRGDVPAPQRAKRYTVTFHQRGREPMHEWHRQYVITYAIDADTNQGYVYLPGPNDGDVYKRNVFSIVRDVEGNWFHASADWEKSVRPLIEFASARAESVAKFKIVAGFDPRENRVVLKCVTGCAWRELSWGCNGRHDCSSGVDASGMTPD